LDRMDGVVDGGDLGHQRLVDREAAGRIEDDHVAYLAAGRLDATTRDVDHRCPGGRPVDGDAEAAPERLELVGGRGTIRVRGDEEGPATQLHDVSRKLGRRGRLA